MMRVATTLLSPEEMGRVSLILTTTAFFAWFLINPVGMFINRRLLAWQAARLVRYYLVFYVIYLLMVTLFAAVSLTLFYVLGLLSFGVTIGWLIFLVCGSLLFGTINQTVIPSLNFLGYGGRFVLLSVATILASFICATFFVKLMQPVAQFWLLGQMLGQIFIGAIGIMILFGKLKPTNALGTQPVIHRRHLHTLFNYAWPVAISAGLSWLQGQGYRYLLEWELGLAQLGLFVAGYGISAGMIAGFESVLTTYLQPRLYRDVSMTDSSDNQAKAWQRYASAVIPSLILTVAFVVMLAPELVRTLLGENFSSASDFVVWGALAEAARVLIGVYSLIAHVYMRTNWLILPNILGAVLSIVLCMILIPNFGAAGVGAALVMSGFSVVFALHSLLASRGGGGVPVRPMLSSSAFAVGLWIMMTVMRHLFDASSRWSMVGSMLIISIMYLGMQYLCLRKHLTEKSYI
jgi:O-antigen/teichoic acid export membrane protein